MKHRFLAGLTLLAAVSCSRRYGIFEYKIDKTWVISTDYGAYRKHVICTEPMVVVLDYMPFGKLDNRDATTIPIPDEKQVPGCFRMRSGEYIELDSLLSLVDNRFEKEIKKQR